MSDPTQKKSTMIGKLFAIIVVLFVLLVIALLLFISQLQSPQNVAQRDAEVAEFLNSSTPDMSSDEQQAVVDVIMDETATTSTTPQQETALVNTLLGN